MKHIPVAVYLRRSAAKTLLFLMLFLLSFSTFAQVSSTYTFANGTTPAHVAMSGGTVLASGTAMDDAIFTNIPIGFTFNFNGVDYTTVGVSTNGFIWFGSTNPAATDYNPISSTAGMAGVASCFGANLVGQAAGASLKYTTTGTCPNRVFMVQWLTMKVVGKTSKIDLQITLTEGSNLVELHPYDASYLVSDSYNAQVGLRGSSNADFNNRNVPCSTSGNWAASTAGTLNTASCQINGSTACSFTSIYPGAPGGSASSVARYRFTNTTSVSSLTWNGSSSSDWFTAANWTPAIVPTSYSNVTIPTSLGTYPVITGGNSLFCKNLTIATGASLSTSAAYTGTFTVMNNLANDGAIINNGSNYITLTSTAACTISGSGDFTNADLALVGSCTNYSLGNDIVIRRLNIATGATLSMNAHNLKVNTTFTQVGTINQSSGLLQIEDVAPTLTDATFNEQTGLTYFATGISTTAANQLIPSIAYNNLKVNVNNGFTATIGTGSTTTCANFTITNPAASGGIASAANVMQVNGNFDLAPTGNTPTFNLSANVTIAGITTLYRGVINTGANKVIVTNTAAAAIAAGPANTDYTISYINGNLRRMILSGATGTYDFPVGDATTSRYAQMNDNGLSGGGFTLLDAYFGALANHLDADMTATEPSEPGVSYTHMCPEGVWFIDPDNQPATGTYDMRLYINGFSSLADDQYAALKRISTSLTGADWSNGGASCTRPASMSPGRTVSSGFALRYGLSSFSQFGIATQTVTPLPIELLDFTAVYNGQDVDLNWHTASELNNDFFTVERSADAAAFSEVLRKKGAGNSTQALHYSDKDNSPLQGISYYRLKQTDFDGASAYSKVVPVNISGSAFEIMNTYIDPATGLLEVTLNCSGNCLIAFELYNAMGMRVYASAEALPGKDLKFYIPVASLDKGIYLLRAACEGKTITKKIKL